MRDSYEYEKAYMYLTIDVNKMMHTFFNFSYDTTTFEIQNYSKGRVVMWWA